MKKSSVWSIVSMAFAMGGLAVVFWTGRVGGVSSHAFCLWLPMLGFLPCWWRALVWQRRERMRATTMLVWVYKAHDGSNYVPEHDNQHLTRAEAAEATRVLKHIPDTYWVRSEGGRVSVWATERDWAQAPTMAG